MNLTVGICASSGAGRWTEWQEAQTHAACLARDQADRLGRLLDYTEACLYGAVGLQRYRELRRRYEVLEMAYQEADDAARAGGE